VLTFYSRTREHLAEEATKQEEMRKDRELAKRDAERERYKAEVEQTNRQTLQNQFLKLSMGENQRFREATQEAAARQSEAQAREAEAQASVARAYVTERQIADEKEKRDAKTGRLRELTAAVSELMKDESAQIEVPLLQLITHVGDDKDVNDTIARALEVRVERRSAPRVRSSRP
jgi:hypothetical protein